MNYKNYVNEPFYKDDVLIGRFTGNVYENGVKDGVVFVPTEINGEWYEHYIIMFFHDNFDQPFYIKNKTCYLQSDNSVVDFIPPEFIVDTI